MRFKLKFTEEEKEQMSTDEINYVYEEKKALAKGHGRFVECVRCTLLMSILMLIGVIFAMYIESEFGFKSQVWTTITIVSNCLWILLVLAIYIGGEVMTTLKPIRVSDSVKFNRVITEIFYIMVFGLCHVASCWVCYMYDSDLLYPYIGETLGFIVGTILYIIFNIPFLLLLMFVIV